MKTKTMPTPLLRNSVSPATAGRGLLLIALALACFALWPAPNAFGVSPPPDGGYAGGSTAEGTNALFSLTGGIWNTALGYQTLFHATTGNQNTATGFQALFTNTTGNFNTATGFRALFSNTTGNDNTANGFEALAFNTTGNDNMANGFQALFSNTTGGDNTADGLGALHTNTTGSNNIAVGLQAGFNLATGNGNIDIGNPGVADESGTIRIGSGGQTGAFIAGIRDVTTGNADAIPVLIDSAGQLGTMSSSRRFKKEIKPMEQTSQAILGLQPVTFQYKSDSKGTPQFGLIAEEVAKVDPDLVVRDAEGEIYTVRYEAVNAMLLNEFLKEHRKVQEQEHKVQQQEASITQLRSTVAQQQKGLRAL